MPLISLDNVTKIYPKGTRPALDDVTVHIDRGDFVFLVGASGSGKTTLLSLLLREEEATKGEIRVAGNDLRRLTNRQVPQYRRSIGFIFQDYKLLNNKTVWQNVAFALEVIGTSRSTIKSLVPKVLETVGLTGKENNYPHELSGGEAQRVAIARAYVNHPQILLADEPTGNLDPTTSLGIMEVLDAINRTGTTIVMATHNEEIVNSMRKRVVELHSGKIVRDEEHGSYDSALFFPDAEVESKAKQVIDTVVGTDASASHDPDSKFKPAAIESTAVNTTVSDDSDEDDGIARLAKSVHSGRTGRYGEAFQPVETTMTWGRGLSLDEMEHAQDHAESEHGDNAEADAREVVDANAAVTESSNSQESEQSDAIQGIVDAHTAAIDESNREQEAPQSAEEAQALTSQSQHDSDAVRFMPASANGVFEAADESSANGVSQTTSDAEQASDESSRAFHAAPVPLPPMPPMPPTAQKVHDEGKTAERHGEGAAEAQHTNANVNNEGEQD